MGPSILQRVQAFPRRLLGRGESTIAAAGLLLASLLLLLIGACAWWSVQVQRDTVERARADEIDAIGSLLAETAGPLLADQELSLVRRLIVDTARRHSFASCSIELADGQVLAHSEPQRITLPVAPAVWPGGPLEPSGVAPPAGSISRRHVLSAPGRGRAYLDVVAHVRQPAWLYWDEVLAGLGLIGAASLLALWMVYRRIRGRVQAVGVVREALLALAEGDSALDTLTIPETLGAEAVAWNGLLRAKGELEKQLLGRRISEVLQAAPERTGDLDSACEVMRQGLILVDRDMKVTYANGAAAVYLGVQRDKAHGAPLDRLVTDGGLLETVRACLANRVRTWTSVEIGPEGESKGVLRLSCRPLRKEDSSAAVIVIDDVTQQRIAEEARNSFVAQVTHELRTPLTNILLYVETAIEEGERDPETRKRCLNVINQEGRRLERIVGDMLSVAEMEAGSYELVRDDLRLDAAFEELERDYQASSAEKGITLEFVLPPKLPVVQADRDKVVMALHNLIGNAIKYTPAGGRVSVTVEDRESAIVVSVADTGIGVREEEHERIFEKFYRAKDGRLAEITGTGLGLAIAREAIRLHGGDIAVESQIDKGSTFVLTLPIVSSVPANIEGRLVA